MADQLVYKGLQRFRTCLSDRRKRRNPSLRRRGLYLPVREVRTRGVGGEYVVHYLAEQRIWVFSHYQVLLGLSKCITMLILNGTVYRRV